MYSFQRPIDYVDRCQAVLYYAVIMFNIDIIASVLRWWCLQDKYS